MTSDNRNEFLGHTLQVQVQEFPELWGHTFTAVYKSAGHESDEIVFERVDGRKFKFHYNPDCCASCYVEDIVGDLNDLVGTPILLAESVCHDIHEEGFKLRDEQYADDSGTWTFYKFGTMKGYVDIRWLGTSNGYYSESVSFSEIK